MLTDEPYGTELIIDLHECDALPCNRAFIEAYVVKLCGLIGMEREDLHFWDYEGDAEAYAAAPEHLKGISAVQFIKTSSVVIHTIDDMKKVFINIFSCKDFSAATAALFSAGYFEGTIKQSTEVDRK